MLPFHPGESSSSLLIFSVILRPLRESGLFTQRRSRSEPLNIDLKAHGVIL